MAKKRKSESDAKQGEGDGIAKQDRATQASEHQDIQIVEKKAHAFACLA